MEKRLIVLLIILSILVQALLFNNLNTARASDDEILARINGERITMSELDGLAREFMINISREEERKEFLNHIIEARLIAQKAREVGLHKDPDIVNTLKHLRVRQLNLRMYDRIKEQIALDENNYKEFIPEYGRQKVRFREIVVQSRPEAEQILKDILNGGNFEQLARERSINIYSKDGGDTGFVTMGKDTFSEEVENIIFELENGQISDILKTREGYAIFKIIERKDFTEKEMKRLIAALQGKLRREKRDMLIERLRSRAEITRFSDNIKKIHEIENFNDETLQIELVSINGTILRLEDMLRSLNNRTMNTLKSRDYCIPSNLEKLVSSNIEMTLIADEAVRIGLDKDPELEKLLKNHEDSLLALKYSRDVLLKDITWTDEEVKEFYNEFKERPEYKNIPECVHARHLLVDDENLARKILKQLKDGADFTLMAEKYSMSVARAEIGSPAGDLGYIKRDDRINITDTEKAALFSLSEGETRMIDMVFNKGDYALYCIVKAEDKINEGANDYNEIKGLMKRELLKRKRVGKIADFIAQLRSEAEIKVSSL